MSTYAIFVKGEPALIDYTPGGDVTAGDVVVQNSMIGFAHLDIPSGTLGTLSVRGGVYDLPKSTSGGSAIAAGLLLYWDASNHVVTTTSSGNTALNAYSAQASVDSDTTQRIVRH